jgi:TonB family protein
MKSLALLCAGVCLLGMPQFASAEETPKPAPAKTDKTEVKPAESSEKVKAPAKDEKAKVPSTNGPAEAQPTEQAASVIPPKLVSRKPSVVCETMVFDSRGKVKVSLKVGEDGKPAEVKVLKGVDATCDAKVLEAVNGLNFEPARIGDATVAVRIRWSVNVAGLPKPKPPPVPKANLKGRVIELGTRTILPGLVVQLRPGNAEAVTDKKGEFEFVGVPHGDVTLIVPSFDHEELRLKVTVPAKEDATLRLDPLPRSKYRITVRRPPPDVSRVIVSAEEAAEIPGGSGDPVRVIEVMPGIAHVSSAGPGAGQIVVRGSAPEDSKYFVDGMPTPQLYHFGNLYSIFQELYIADIDFRTGGFSAEYGDATGGILNLTLAPIKTDGFHFVGDVNVYHTSVAASTPVGEDWAVSAGVRRSYIDAILPAILDSSGAGASLVAAPVYYDYQVRADYTPSPRSQLKLFAYGSDDNFSVDFSEPSASDPSTTGFGLGRKTHQIQATYTTKFNPDLGLRLGLVTGYQALQLKIGTERNFNLRVCPLVLRSDLDARLSDTLKIRGGLWASITSYGVSLDLSRPSKEGQVNLPTASQEQFSIDVDGFNERLDGWVEVRYEPVKELGLILGGRAASWYGTFSDAAFEPRASVYWQAAEGTRLTLGGGLNYQAPFPDETDPEIGNPNLSAERSAYVVAGLKQQVGEVFSFDFQVFAKFLGSLVSPTTFDPENLDQVPYDNGGSGTVMGAELLARLATDRFNAWLSYTLSRSVRQDRPGEPERLFSYDQTHVLSLVSSVVIGAGWKAGVRMRYSTGNPYTPLVAGYYDSDSDVYVPRPGAEPLSERIEPFLALDIRVSKEFRFEDWMLDVYLEINNATNRENVENVGYTYDYSSRQDINGLPLVPSFGLKGVY